MTRWARVAIACAALVGCRAMSAAAQDEADVALEYRVKAAYLFNFTKFVEWPVDALPDGAALTICVAGRNPFGPALEETIRGEAVNGHPLAARTVRTVDGCHVLFVPRGVPLSAYMRRPGARPMLTVGESDDFLEQGGIVRFVLEDGRVQFEINHGAAEGAQLRVSSRLLRLARPINMGRRVR